MKRLVVVVLLMGILTVLTACNPIDDINAVVNNFWEQWKAGNAANMVDLMTDEVEYALLIPDNALVSSLTKLPATKGIPAEMLVEALVSSSIPTLGTLSISSTEEFGKYAIVTCLFTANADPNTKLGFIFHLNDTDDGWKINFFGIKEII